MFSILLKRDQAEKNHFAYEFYQNRICQLKLTPSAL